MASFTSCSDVHNEPVNDNLYPKHMISDGEVSLRLPWHSLSPEEATAELDSSPGGLAGEEAADRLTRHGPNQLVGAPPVSPFQLLLDEFRTPLVIVLLAAALVLVGVSVLGEDSDQLVDAVLIGLIVLLNAGLGFTQNYRANRGIESLNRLAALSAEVLRDGVPEKIDAKLVVPGDVVLLEEGDRVPADGRLLESVHLRIDESALTGESVPVAKTSASSPEGAILAERFSMVYSSTVVMRGRGRMLVTDTGMRTEVGKIAEEVQTTDDEPTVFEREVGKLAVRIGWAVAVLIAVVAGLQLLIGELTVLETFITAVALAVAAVPEGLPVVLTLALAFGTRRILERRALVRSLPVVEIVGAAQVICSDKTGTITEGRMTVRQVSTANEDVASDQVAAEGGDGPLAMAVLAAGLCNNAHRHPDHGYVGDPTETALLELADRSGASLESYERSAEIPFASERKMMSVVAHHPGDADGLMLTKGAPEVVLPICDRLATPQGVVSLTDEQRSALVEKNRALAGQALRVLALAYKPQGAQAQPTEEGLIFAGLAAMSDPPRREAAEAIAAARRAGIRVVMITGDHTLTAAAIGREVGLEGETVEAKTLDEMDQDRLGEVIRHTDIFARAEPRHKVKILRALKEEHDVVVMTGDGVNDAPALHNADVGIAMGIKGTDVARDTSDMVLLDDNFATIVSAVEEGRRIFGNIKKFVNYLLTGNLAEVLVILVSTVFGYLPITAVQILWINLVTDSGPAVALAVDPAPKGVMREPPSHGAVLGRSMAALVGTVGVIVSIILLATFFVALGLWDLETARTATFTGFVIHEYLRLLVIRVQEQMPPFTNKWLWISVTVSLLLQVGIIYTSFGNIAFGTVALGLGPWVILLAGLVVGFITTVLASRWVVRRFGPL